MLFYDYGLLVCGALRCHRHSPPFRRNRCFSIYGVQDFVFISHNLHRILISHKALVISKLHYILHYLAYHQSLLLKTTISASDLTSTYVCCEVYGTISNLSVASRKWRSYDVNFTTLNVTCIRKRYNSYCDRLRPAGECGLSQLFW